MTLIAKEKPRAAGGHSRRDIVYYVKDDAGGNVTPEQAVNKAVSQFGVDYGTTYYGMPFVDYDYNELATDRYDVTLTFAPASLEVVKPEPEIGAAQYSFATTLETVHIQTSLETKASYADTDQLPDGVETAYDFQQAINVDVEGNIQGITIQVPVTRFKYRYRIPFSLVTPQYQLLIEDLAGKVNGSVFKGRPPGTTRFDGATGGIRSGEDWDVEFNFTKRPNLENITVGNIEGVSADGWDVIWPYYISKSAGARGFSAPSPAYLYVEQVYPRADLNTLRIP